MQPLEPEIDPERQDSGPTEAGVQLPEDSWSPATIQRKGDVQSADVVHASTGPQPEVTVGPTDAITSALSGPADVVTQAFGNAASSRAVDPQAAVASPGRRFFRPQIPHLRVPARVHTFDSFQYREYRFLWGMTFFSSAAFWLQQVIVGWLMYSITQSAFLTSIAMGLDALPVLLAGPLGGLLVDSLDKRKLLIGVFIYQAVSISLFAALVMSGGVVAWHIFAFTFLMGVSWVITDPARMSLIPNIVPTTSLINAFALNSLAFSATRLVAPAVGGLVVALGGPGPALVIQATLPFVAALCVFAMRIPAIERQSLNLNKAYSGILEAARYIINHRVILGMIIISALPAVFVMPFAHGLIPVYAAEVFFVGPGTLGLLMASVGAGSLIGTLVLASVGDVHHKGRLMVGSVFLSGVFMALFAANRSLILAFPALMLISAGTMLFFSTASASIASILPDKLRGRVSGLYMMSFGFMPLGSVTAGALAQHLGPNTATLIGSGLMVICLTAMSLTFREVWKHK